jgi:8-oxo-dGTP diphosphatase
MHVFVLRHACAGRKGGWPGPDADRPLDAVGRQQAEALADVLAGQGVRRLVSSPSLRCVDTLRPLARRLQLTIERAPGLEARAGSSVLEDVIADQNFDGAVVCTHGEVMQPFLEQLRGWGVPVPDRESADALLSKGTGWWLEVQRGTVASLELCAPAGRPDCVAHGPTTTLRAHPSRVV